MPKKKHITIDDLAVMIKTGFDAVDARFDAVDARFDAAEAKLSNVEAGVAELKVRVGAIEQRLENIEETLEDHFEELRFINKKIDEWTDPRSKKRLMTYEEYTKLESRITELEKKVGLKK